MFEHVIFRMRVLCNTVLHFITWYKICAANIFHEKNSIADDHEFVDDPGEKFVELL